MPTFLLAHSEAKFLMPNEKWESVLLEEGEEKRRKEKQQPLVHHDFPGIVCDKKKGGGSRVSFVEQEAIDMLIF